LRFGQDFAGYIRHVTVIVCDREVLETYSIENPVEFCRASEKAILLHPWFAYAEPSFECRQNSGQAAHDNRSARHRRSQMRQTIGRFDRGGNHQVMHSRASDVLDYIHKVSIGQFSRVRHANRRDGVEIHDRMGDAGLFKKIRCLTEYCGLTTAVNLHGADGIADAAHKIQTRSGRDAKQTELQMFLKANAIVPTECFCRGVMQSTAISSQSFV